MDHPRITQNPNVMFGKPCIIGRRITVELILENLGAGRSMEAVAKDYDITLEDVREVLAYADNCLQNNLGLQQAGLAQGS